MTDDQSILIRKHELRQHALRSRDERSDKELGSQQICSRLLALPEYQHARVICSYVSLPDEVQTMELIASAWNDRKRLAVPCCIGNELELFHLTSLSELAPRTLGILEPRRELRAHADRWLDPAIIDLFVVPGVAFDRFGGRLGYGKGFYDRLLARSRADAVKIAVTFQCQIVPQIPMGETDIFMDFIVAEDFVYRRQLGTETRR